MTKKIVVSIALCFVFLFSTACRKDGPMNAVPVTGQVKVNGQTAAGVSVMFSPVDANAYGAAGVTDSSGNFALTIAGAKVNSGAIPGQYVPTFLWDQSPVEGMSEEEIQKKYPDNPPSAINVLPEKYAGKSTTDIEPISVERGKKNHFEFDLQTK